MQTFLKKSKILLLSLLTIVVVCAAGSPVAHAAATYTDTDIYNLLYAAFYGSPAEDSPYMPKSLAWHMDRLVNNNLYYHQQFNSKLADIKTAIQNINGNNSPTTKELKRIADMMLYGFDRSDPDAPMPCILMDMNDNLLKLRDIVTNTNYLSSINSNINSLKTNVSNLDDTVSLGLSLNNDKLTEIQSTLKYINFGDPISNLVGVSTTDRNYISANTTVNTDVLTYIFNPVGYSPRIIYARLPFSTTTNDAFRDISFTVDTGYINNGVFTVTSNNNSFYYTYSFAGASGSPVTGFIDLFINPSGRFSPSLDYAIRLNFDKSFPLRYLSSDVSSSHIYSVDVTNKDYYVIDNLISNHSNLDIMKDFKFLYADDDAIKKKQESSLQSSAALDAFSGDGSAAASVGNITDAAGISSSLSSNLSTGVSADAALSALDGSSYGFWSKSVSDNINSLWVPSSPRLLRSSGSYSSSAPVVVDVMDNYHLELDSLIRRYSD